MITKNMISAGYQAGLVTLCESPNEDGVVCKIGECWFYFGGMTAEGCTVEEYKANVPEEDIIDEIFRVLDDFRKSGPELEDEYIYYECFLREHGIEDAEAKASANLPVCKSMYRIVMTCWDAGAANPYSDSVETIFDTEEAAHQALRSCVKDELETLNDRAIEDIDLDYPSEVDSFKADFDGDEFDAIIRLWDGDDYQPVTGYSVAKVEALSDDFWRYRETENRRGFYICKNKEGNRYAVEYMDERLCVKHSLEAALDFVDEELLRKCNKSPEKEWKLPVTWEVCGFVKIKAKTLEEAIEIFNETSDDIPLPEDSSYVDGSFALSSNDPEYIQVYNN